MKLAPRDRKPSGPGTAKLFSWCGTAGAVASGAICSTTDADGWHALCKGAMVDGQGRIHRCSCSCHDGIHTCVNCGTQIDGAVDPETVRCFDEDACHVRFRERMEASPMWSKIQEARRRAEAAAEAQPETTKRPPKERERRTGRCHHCGETTGGGKFLPGHDMKLKGELFAIARSPETTEASAKAAAEIQLRRWSEKGIPGATLDAAFVYVQRKGFLESVLEERWS